MGACAHTAAERRGYSVRPISIVYPRSLAKMGISLRAYATEGAEGNGGRWRVGEQANLFRPFGAANHEVLAPQTIPTRSFGVSG
jgi:hypothetical protein